jgi:hypothetical protein
MISDSNQLRSPGEKPPASTAYVQHKLISNSSEEGEWKSRRPEGKRTSFRPHRGLEGVEHGTFFS